MKYIAGMRIIIRKFWAILFLVIAPCAAPGQSETKRTCSGLITDEANHPLPYVSVFIKGSYDGDVSDATGRFEIVTEKSGNIEDKKLPDWGHDDALAMLASWHLQDSKMTDAKNTAEAALKVNPGNRFAKNILQRLEKQSTE